MEIITNILAFVIIVGVLVTIHEAGHFLAGKIFKFPVEIFSIGFGPKIFSFKKRETEYRISSIPLGGFVKIKGIGMDESALFSKEEVQERGNKTQKFLIFFSGPLTNILLCIFLLTFSFMLGIEVPSFLKDPVITGYVEKESPAEKAGIETGDEIIEIDGKKVENWEEFKKVEVLSAKKNIKIKFKRNEKIFENEVFIEKKGKYKIGYIGIYPYFHPKVAKIEEKSPAEISGIKKGDVILEIDGKKISHAFILINYISENPDKEVLLKIKRGDGIIYLKAKPEKTNGKGRLGVYLQSISEETILKKYGFFEALKEAIKSSIENTTLALKVLKNFLSGRGDIAQISGPVDIAKFSGEAMRSGLSYFLNIMGLISLQLAIFNLLPIPALDGGHLFILLIEIIIRKNLSKKLKLKILQFGFALLLSLMIIVLISDLLKIL